MKRTLILSLLAAAFILSVSDADAKYRYGHDLPEFYFELRHSGKWIEFDDGLVVWKPRIYDMGWAPYRSGEWIWTDMGWYWYSYESFGEIVYHYGRWFFDDYYGWVWVPDYEWAPAWVDWRYSDDLIGWAPMSPYATFSVSFGIRYTRVYVIPVAHWNFVYMYDFNRPYIGNYFVAERYKYRYYDGSRPYENSVYRDGDRYAVRGIDKDIVERGAGTKIKTRNLVFDDKESRVDDKKVIVRNKFSGDRNNGSRDEIKFERPDSKISLNRGDVDAGRDSEFLKERDKARNTGITRNNDNGRPVISAGGGRNDSGDKERGTGIRVDNGRDDGKRNDGAGIRIENGKNDDRNINKEKKRDNMPEIRSGRDNKNDNGNIVTEKRPDITPEIRTGRDNRNDNNNKGGNEIKRNEPKKEIIVGKSDNGGSKERDRTPEIRKTDDRKSGNSGGNSSNSGRSPQGRSENNGRSKSR